MSIAVLSVGMLRALVIQGAKVIDECATGEDYGIVSLSGSCGSQVAGMGLVAEEVQMGKIH
ncbi:MAG: hypothetical protein WBL44_14965 [Nitrososphaeraceae archaeon]